MSFTRKIEQLRQLDQLIRLHATGNSSQLAQKLHISESTLFLLLQSARDLGAEISYNPYKYTYEYITPMRFVFGFHSEERIKLSKIMGGVSFGARTPFQTYNSVLVSGRLFRNNINFQHYFSL